MPSIRRFLRLCTCVWGGRYNPIIPFFEKTPERWSERRSSKRGLDIARGYVNFFEPDVIVEALPGMADELGWKHDSIAFDMPRLVSLEEFFSVGDRGRVDFAAGLDVLHVFADLYDKEYKFERRHKAPFALFDSGDNAEAFFDVFCGTYPNDEALKYFRDNYTDVFDAVTLPATSETYLKLMDEGYRGPYWVTRFGLKESFRQSRRPAIFVLDPADGQDVIDYWNLPLVQRDVVPVNLHWFSECSSFIRDIIKKTHRPLPGNDHGVMASATIVFGRSINEDKVSSLLQLHLNNLTSGSFYSTRDYRNFWDVFDDRFQQRPRKLVVTANSVSFDEEIGEDGYVKIPSPAPEFENSAAIYTRSAWINVVRSTAQGRESRAATVFPSNLWSPTYPARLLSHQSVVTREGWVEPQTTNIGYSLLRPMGCRDAIIGWFDDQGIAARPSDAGQVADQLISAAGGLLACGMFADEETINLLNSMAESHSQPRRRGRSVQRKAPDRAKPFRYVQTAFKDREKRSWGFWTELDYFLERSVFRAGLRIQCPNCAYYNWYDLKSVDYSLVCNRCLQEFAFKQAPDHLKQANWYYRVIGPFATPDYAQGGYAVSLTLRCLAGEVHHRGAATWSTGLELQPFNVEIDFALWYRREHLTLESEMDEPIFMIGEAKSFGDSAFRKKDIEDLIAVAEKLPGTILVVSTLKSIHGFSEAELRLIKRLATWGRAERLGSRPRNPVIVLTGAELLTDRPIRKVWEEAGGKAANLVKHPSVFLSDPYELAELTQILYLDLPAFHVDVQEPSGAS